MGINKTPYGIGDLVRIKETGEIKRVIYAEYDNIWGDIFKYPIGLEGIPFKNWCDDGKFSLEELEMVRKKIIFTGSDIKRMIPVYIIEAWIMNTPNLIKEFKDIGKANEQLNTLMEQEDCTYVKMNVRMEKELFEFKKDIKLYIVEYYSYGEKYEEEFTDEKDAKDFIVKYNHKYDKMNIMEEKYV